MHKILISFLAVAFSLPAYAFRLSPMTVHFAPKGKLSTQVLTLDNPGPDKVPVQIEIFSRTDSETGEEKRIKTSEFTVYPEQVVLLPNEKRNVRVTWTGEISDQEKSYRLIATQLPVELKDSNSKVKKAGANLSFLLQYVASMYVTPEGVAPRVKVREAQVLSSQKISVLIENEGLAHQVLTVKSFKVFEKDKLIEEMSKVPGLDGINILAKGKRRVVVNLSKPVKGHQVRVELSLVETPD